MNNQRGIFIFITNILRKFLEIIIHARSNRNLRKGISEHQNRSTEKRSICDNLLTLQAIIYDNKKIMKVCKQPV